MPEPTDADLCALAAEEMRIATRGAMLASDREVLARGVLAAVLPKVAEQLTRRADAVPWSDPTLRRGIQYAASVVRSLAETQPATGPESTQPDATARTVAQEAPNAPGSSEGARDARAIARTWLTWAITRAASTAQGNREIADAILNTLGVEVCQLDGYEFVATGAMVEDDCGCCRRPEQVLQRTARVVIRLPAQPIEDGHDG